MGGKASISLSLEPFESVLSLRILRFAFIITEMNESVLQYCITLNLDSFSSNRPVASIKYQHTFNLKCYVLLGKKWKVTI